MGMDTNVEIECRDSPAREGDRYLLLTDGVHGFVDDKGIGALAPDAERDLNAICEALVKRALAAGSNDNCSAILVEVENLGVSSNADLYRQFTRLPFPPELYPGMVLDGYEVEKELQATSRSQTYLVAQRDSGERMVMKTPSVNYEDEISYLERFTMEGWIGSKAKNPQLVASLKPAKGQTFLYTLLEYIEGDSLAEWIEKNDTPDIPQAIGIAKNLIQALRAMHRLEMLHQDLKPGNVIQHPERGAVLIDYGSTFVPGIQEIETPFERERALGTLSYSAPEYFLNRKPSPRSDQFSLGVTLYEMLTGEMPYGPKYEKCRSLREFAALEYRPITRINSMVPTWVDGAIRKAVQVNPQKRYESLSEFEYDLERPNKEFLPDDTRPFIERSPHLFWKIAAGILAVSQIATLWLLLK